MLSTSPCVYLGGLISGLSYEQAHAWRVDAAVSLAGHGVAALDPMRDMAHLVRERCISRQDYPLNVRTMAKAIRGRCKFDVRRSDVVLMNLLGATQVSIGCSWEVGLADAWDKPVVLIMEEEHNPHEHLLLGDASLYRTDTLESGLALCISLLVV